MGTATVMTSDALIQLEADVTELTTKLNGVITEYNLVQADMTTNKTAIDSLKTQFNFAESDLTNHKGKIDTLITDVEDINDKISANYTATTGSGGGYATDSILKRLHHLDQDFVDLDNSLNSGGTASRGGGTTSYTLNDVAALGTPTTGTASDGSAAITAGTADQSVSTASASVTPSYSTGETKVVTLGDKGEVRARKLTRQTLNRLRK